MLLAQISDMHIGVPGSDVERRFDSATHLERAVQHLCRLEPRPDVVLCTGDLVNDGSPEEYARLAALLKPLPMPCYVIAGNHDDREHLRAAFAHQGYLPEQGFLHYVVELGPLRLIGLDTNVPGAPGGRLCADRLAWLDARLSEAPERPTLVFMHHPPFRTGIHRVDAMGLEGSEALAAVIGRHPQVERILCGHLHRPIVKRFAGTVASTCPSTMHQVALDLELPGRITLVPEPPACQLHLWSEATGLVSHLSYIGDFRSAA
ncbi:phosphodiesterase [Pyxidicoccus fallax]|uniref:Phosphodiesterase n=1 Tax=Pyxidicoccus fallax TaxID=394095 RepID=A0A848LWM7_9BACT|nr:phosphodiesterase [Pyxidicoccus fallax]NMO22528.1 phosphodiesterase [Pyxidicoccus fallax]NPC85217.1 phosphodiesterase [Pyxidicoccus fallax]